MNDSSPVLLGLRTVIYPAPDLAASKAWATAMLGVEPYFDTDFYVGYSVAGYELALDPNGDPDQGAIVYWGVADAEAATRALVAGGATADDEVQDVGDGIRTATFSTPLGVFAVIENPHFRVAPRPVGTDGAGQ